MVAGSGSVRVRSASFGAVLLASTLGPALAEDAGPGAAVLRRKLDIARTCAPAIARLCPAMVNAAQEPRNVAICLRPYRTSLSLPCRSAVSAWSG